MIYEINHMWTAEMKWNEEMNVAVNTIYAIAWRSLKEILFTSFACQSAVCVCRTKRSLFNRTSRIWNALAADLGQSVICSLSSFKARRPLRLLQTSSSYIPNEPRSSKLICLTCNVACERQTFLVRQDFSAGDGWRVAGRRVAGRGWRVAGGGSGRKKEKIKIKGETKKEKKDNKHYKKRYFSNILLHDIACTR